MIPAGTPRPQVVDRYVLAIQRWRLPARGRSGLSAIAKWGWFHVYTVAGGIERNAVVHAGTLARELGSDDARTGRGVIDALEDLGLIKVLSRAGGEITVYLEDPERVKRARFVPGENDDQGELFEQDQVDVEEVPEAGATLPLRAEEGFLPHSRRPRSCTPTLRPGTFSLSC